MDPEHAMHRPACPRCGYDQSGTLDTWTDRCPVYGQCPECGTRFEWAVLLDPTRVDLPWLVEHTRGWWGLVRRTPGMVGRLVWPRWFWRPVGIHARIGLRWLACWCLGTLLVTHLLTGVGLMVAEWVFLDRLYPANAGIPDEIRARIITGSFLGPLVTVRAPQGASSVWQGLATLRLTLGGVPMLVMAMLAFNLLWIVNLTVMPVTRRAAKLRVAHVARAAIIGVWAAWLAMEAERVAGVCWMLFPRSTIASVSRWVLVGVQACLCLWTVAWWWSAVRFGWGLPQARLTSVLTTIAGVLAAVTVVLWFDTRAVLRWLELVGLWSVW